MNCPSCSPQLPLPPPSNVPPLLYPPPPPLSSIPPPPLSRTPPPPRGRTPRSSEGRWFNSSVAASSVVTISSVALVGFFIVIIRQYFLSGEPIIIEVPVPKIIEVLVLEIIKVPEPVPVQLNRETAASAAAVGGSDSNIPRYALSIAFQFVFTPGVSCCRHRGLRH